MDDRKQDGQVLDSHEELVTKFSAGLMTAVRITGVLDGANHATMTHATEVMRRELKALANGEGEYGEALRAIEDGALHEGFTMALVITKCVEKINAFKRKG